MENPETRLNEVARIAVRLTGFGGALFSRNLSKRRFPIAALRLGHQA